VVQHTTPLEPVGSRCVARVSTGQPPRALTPEEARSEVDPRSRSLSGTPGTAAVEAGKEQPAQGMQKPPLEVGKKRFLGVFLAAPIVMV
jgi:hypothetical protein